MSEECDNCGMDFDTVGELETHKRKFCSGDDDEDGISKRIEELKKMEHDLDYDYQATQANKRAAAPTSQPVDAQPDPNPYPSPKSQ